MRFGIERTVASGLIVLLLAAGAIGCRGGATSGGDETSSAPPVVLITVDGWIGDQPAAFGGSEPTPQLQRLLDDSTHWLDTWTASPTSRSAVATYLTGLAPDRHGVRGNVFTPLRDDVPTLATTLGDSGYRTAAFPGSSFLGSWSGLLRGFDVVDDPPGLVVSPARWFPRISREDDAPGNFSAWVAALPPDSAYFGWIHVAQPMLIRLSGLAENPWIDPRKPNPDADVTQGPFRPAYERLESAIEAVVDALESRGDLDRAVIVVAGTQADPLGAEDELFGPGFSLRERMIRVPLVVKFPTGLAPAAGADAPRWSPDVPRTIAALTGIRLSPEAEGTSLLEAPGPDRILYSWTWATEDQMGWKPLRAARQGSVKRVEGVEDRTTDLSGSETVDPGVEQALIRALASRSESRPPTVPLDVIRPLALARGIEIGAGADLGRELSPKARHRASWFVWHGRALIRASKFESGPNKFNRALKLDPDNLGALLDRGQFFALGRPADSFEPLESALRLYPTNPEVIHWYAHAVWTEGWQEAQALLEAIRPFKAAEGDLLYDLACIRSLASDLPGAEQFLRSAIDAGFREWDHMEVDADLRNLRESGRFSAILREYNQ